jgi:hypothetical protein
MTLKPMWSYIFPKISSGPVTCTLPLEMVAKNPSAILSASDIKRDGCD